MSAIGWIMFILLAVLFFPLVPFIAVAWLVMRLVGYRAGRGDRDDATIEA
jgi:hypothetical protein